VITTPPIVTPRLELHVVWPDEYRRLAVDRADPQLWVDRGFTNPHRHLVDDPGPLRHRIPRVAADPEAAPFYLRLAVLRADHTIVGSAGFHDRPDRRGMVEVGLGVVPSQRGQGLAQELLHGLWGWVVTQPGVEVLRYTVAVSNAPSQAIIRKLGFAWCGQQVDPVDGTEDIFELDARVYRARLGA
jgi:ribosomal-protein-alanine N-acetyltransferase